MYTFAMWLTHRHNWAKKFFGGGPNSSRPSKLAIWKHNHAFLPFKVHYWFLNIIWDLLMANLGPSDDKFGTFWGVQGPSWSPSWLHLWLIPTGFCPSTYFMKSKIKKIRFKVGLLTVLPWMHVSIMLLSWIHGCYALRYNSIRYTYNSFEYCFQF